MPVKLELKHFENKPHTPKTQPRSLYANPDPQYSIPNQSMAALGFVFFVACLCGAYKLGHSAGYISGKRDGGKEGYVAGIAEGVRVSNLAKLAQEDPDEYDRQQHISRIVDAEFDDFSH